MAGEERNLTNRDDSRPVRVKVDNVKKIYNGRNGEMVALNGVTLDIHDNELFVSEDHPDVENPLC